MFRLERRTPQPVVSDHPIQQQWQPQELPTSIQTPTGGTSATSSTEIVNLFLRSEDSPLTPGNPTRASLKEFGSTRSMTSSMNICSQNLANEQMHMQNLEFTKYFG
ncbi:hypothetical protein ACLOJK_009890 [Asimina triloba]